MESSTGEFAHVGEDAEFVATGVDADPVSESLGDGGVNGEFLLELIRVASVVYALLELAAEPGSHTADPDLSCCQLASNKIVSLRRSGNLCFIDGNLK